jgi:hypothetical protein
MKRVQPSLSSRVSTRVRGTRPCCILESVLLAVVLASLAAWAAPASADRTVLLTPIGTSFGPVYAEGAWAAYQPTESSTWLADSSRDDAVTRPNPPGCAGTGELEGMGLVALGGGELLYRCADPSCPLRESECQAPDGSHWLVRYVVEDAASDARAEISELPETRDGRPWLIAIGSSWAEGFASRFEPGATTNFAVNWRTGKLDLSRGGELDELKLELEDHASRFVALNNPSPLGSYCAPIRRRPSKILGENIEELPFNPPFAIESQGSYPAKVLLRRCGSDRSELLSLSQGGEGMQSGQIDGGIASWVATSEGGGSAKVPMFTRLLPHGRRWHGPVYRLYQTPTIPPGAPPNSMFNSWEPRVLLHTATEIFEARRFPEPSFRFEIYAARIPQPAR